MQVLDWMRPPAPARGPAKVLSPLLFTGPESCYLMSPKLILLVAIPPRTDSKDFIVDLKCWHRPALVAAWPLLPCF